MKRNTIFITLATILPIIMVILLANYAATKIYNPGTSLDAKVVLDLFTKFVILGFAVSLFNGLFMYLALRKSKKPETDLPTLI